MDEANSKAPVLTDSILIGILLDKAKSSRSLLTVNLPNSKEEYLSIILDIDEEAGYLYLDEFKPSEGINALKKTKTFIAYAMLQGVGIGFRSELVKIQRSKLQTQLCVKFPERLQYKERRKSHRVPVAIGLEVTADIVEMGKPPINMRVTDICAEGIGLITDSEKYKQITASQNELRCIAHFPEQTEEWNVRIQLCREERLSKGNKKQFGARFLELTTKQKDILHHQLRFFDRENIRKSVAY